MPTKSGISTIRSHVSRFGRLNGIARFLMQFLIDFLGERAADPVDLCEIVDARREQAPQTAEAREQALAALRADAVDRFQRRSIARFCASCAVPGDREAMRFVAHL